MKDENALIQESINKAINEINQEINKNGFIFNGVVGDILEVEE